MHALFLRNLTINPLILKVFALTKVGETSGAGVGMGSKLVARTSWFVAPIPLLRRRRNCVFDALRFPLQRQLSHPSPFTA